MDISSRRARAHPTIALDAAAKGMQSASFRLPSGLRVARKLKGGKRYGNLTFTTDSGATDTKLVDLWHATGKRAATELSATRDGTQVTGVSFTYKKANEIGLSGLPDGTTALTLELAGDVDRFLTLPRVCRSKPKKGSRKARGDRKRLSFPASITNSEGRTFNPTYETGLLCPKKAKKKRTKRRR